VNPFITPVYFVVFVLIAQFVLVNVVVAVLMKHLEVSHGPKIMPLIFLPIISQNNFRVDVHCDE